MISSKVKWAGKAFLCCSWTYVRSNRRWRLSRNTFRLVFCMSGWRQGTNRFWIERLLTEKGNSAKNWWKNKVKKDTSKLKHKKCLKTALTGAFTREMKGTGMAFDETHGTSLSMKSLLLEAAAEMLYISSLLLLALTHCNKILSTNERPSKLKNSIKRLMMIMMTWWVRIDIRYL